MIMLNIDNSIDSIKYDFDCSSYITGIDGFDADEIINKTYYIVEYIYWDIKRIDYCLFWGKNKVM